MWCRWWNNINRNIRCSCLPWRWYVCIIIPFVFTFTVSSVLRTLFCMAFLLDILTHLTRNVVYGYWANHLVIAEKEYPWSFILFLILILFHPLANSYMSANYIGPTWFLQKQKVLGIVFLGNGWYISWAISILKFTLYIFMSCHTYWSGV